MKVLMLGWELPPHNSGGLGEACLGLTKELTKRGVEIIFVLPKKVDLEIDFMRILFANINESKIELQNAYFTDPLWISNQLTTVSPNDFVSGSIKFAKRIKEIVAKLRVDLIHAHDWMTFPAGLMAKKLLGVPLVLHVHATEFDRTSGHYPNPSVYKIEKEGVLSADKVITVSEFTKNSLVTNYQADSRKIEVVHNGIDFKEWGKLPPALTSLKKLGYKIVLFLGRITLQKGPEYFVQAAKRVLEYDKKVVFVVAGSGDMQGAMINEAIQAGIMNNMLFTGFIRGEERGRIYQSADLFVMPSVSEPFGITSLEAIANGIPVLMSKQSGVSEVINHALKVDFWDIEEMANKILAVIRHSPLAKEMVLESSKELVNVTWGESAKKCLNVYKKIV